MIRSRVCSIVWLRWVFFFVIFFLFLSSIQTVTHIWQKWSTNKKNYRQIDDNNEQNMTKIWFLRHQQHTFSLAWCPLACQWSKYFCPKSIHQWQDQQQSNVTKTIHNVQRQRTTSHQGLKPVYWLYIQRCSEDLFMHQSVWLFCFCCCCCLYVRARPRYPFHFSSIHVASTFHFHKHHQYRNNIVLLFDKNCFCPQTSSIRNIIRQKKNGLYALPHMCVCFARVCIFFVHPCFE